MFKLTRGVLVGLTGLVLAPVAAHAADAAKAFGARPAVLSASLSPDGQSIALVQPLAEAQASAVFVARLDGTGTPKPVLTANGKPYRLTSCGWVTNTRLICELRMLLITDATRMAYSRMVALNADGAEVKEMTAKPSSVEVGYHQDGGDVVDWLSDDDAGVVLMTRQYEGEISTGSLMGVNARKGLAVERVDTVTMVRTPVEAPRGDTVNYISDQHGGLRIMAVQPRNNAGYRSDEVTYFHRPAAGGQWTAIPATGELAGFRPWAVDRDLNAAYGFQPVNGHDAMVRVSLDGSWKREVLVARDDVDVDGLIRIGRQRRVVGASFVTDKRQTVFFDPGLRALEAALSKALPGNPRVSFVDASKDEKRLLLWAGSDVDPGGYYLYDRNTRKLAPVMPERPDLADIKLAPVKAITYAAADGTQVPAYLTLPPGSEGKTLPTIVMPHGGPSARDEWGFDWLAQYFAHQGFAVLQPNFRGSSGYGEAWFQKNGFQSWKTAIGDVNDAGRWLTAQGVAAPGKLAIIGWSYGGYAALQSAVVDPDLFKAIVAIAPVTDLETWRQEFKNFTNYKIVDAFVGRGPHVKEGSPAQNAARIKAPVLLFHGDQDINVGAGESRLMQARLKAVGAKSELVVYPGLDHQLDDAATRERMLSQIDQFLRASLGM
ncbi:S9 family peptidase [Caulobacter sp.]|uniref:alpha/beta hydrolase family protein n=1 Tax=Caulobacter sp. TaxID=78 RepID=UPI001B280764|nr:S9 family peptidase [Caulobacter sp.]MBO9544298.1 S9 family peptidase [Caulobacter sp.]